MFKEVAIFDGMVEKSLEQLKIMDRLCSAINRQTVILCTVSIKSIIPIHWNACILGQIVYRGQLWELS